MKFLKLAGILFSMVVVAVVFQNCADTSFDSGAEASKAAAAASDNSDWLNFEDDDGKTTDQLPADQINTATASKYKCTYNMKGSDGFVWVTERYVVDYPECSSSELAVVKAKNPKASVTHSYNFVYDPLLIPNKFKCTYSMNNGTSNWYTERYVASEKECGSSELLIVKANNPLAKISYKSNYVFDDIADAKKYKCTFVVSGGGVVKTLEYYVDEFSRDSCGTSQLSVVQAANPGKAVKYNHNFVNDPF